MDHIDTSEQIWKGKVIRYRKWEQRPIPGLGITRRVPSEFD